MQMTTRKSRRYHALTRHRCE